jgi:hypothetical protein
MKGMKNTAYYLLIMTGLLAFMMPACRKSSYELPGGLVTVSDNGEGTGTVSWKKENNYLLEGFVFVNDGQVLTIEAGTVIRARPGQGAAASALIVARGGKIIARGTAKDPIIFTAEGDDLQGSVPPMTKGLWGGVIILGNAPLNLSAGESNIEGIPLTEPRAVYGGPDPDDDSGVLQYVSVRHAGTNIGEGNEINGLTLGGVGNKTVIDHVEVISCIDDGLEFFGGTVNYSHVLVAFCGDDLFDYDLGYQGYGQFLLGVQDPAGGDKVIECTGGIDPVTGQPFTMPVIYNASFFGRGSGMAGKMADFSFNGAGTIANSIMVFQDMGCFVEFVEGSPDSYWQFEKNNLQILNNVFWGFPDLTPAGIFSVYSNAGADVTQQNAVFRGSFLPAGNITADPGLEMQNGKYGVIPDGNVFDNFAPYPSAWFEDVDFKGAFYTYDWTAGWTLFYQAGFMID